MATKSEAQFGSKLYTKTPEGQYSYIESPDKLQEMAKAGEIVPGATREQIAQATYSDPTTGKLYYGGADQKNLQYIESPTKLQELVKSGVADLRVGLPSGWNTQAQGTGTPTTQEQNLYNVDTTKTDTAEELAKTQQDYMKSTDPMAEYGKLLEKYGAGETGLANIKKAQDELIEKYKNSPEQLAMLNAELEKFNYTQKRQEMDGIDMQLADMYTNIRNIGSEVTAQYPEASKTQIDREISRRMASLQPQYERMLNTRNALASQLDKDFQEGLKRSEIGLDDALRKERGYTTAVDFAISNFERGTNTAKDFYDIFTNERQQTIDLLTGTYERKKQAIDFAFSNSNLLFSGVPPQDLPPEYLESWKKASEAVQRQILQDLEQGKFSIEQARANLAQSILKGQSAWVNGQEIKGQMLTPEEELQLQKKYSRSGGGGGIGGFSNSEDALQSTLDRYFIAAGEYPDRNELLSKIMSDSTIKSLISKGYYSPQQIEKIVDDMLGGQEIDIGTQTENNDGGGIDWGNIFNKVRDINKTAGNAVNTGAGAVGNVIDKGIDALKKIF